MQLLRLKDVAEKLGVEVSTIRAWILHRKITYHKIGHSVRVSTDEVDRIIQAGTVVSSKRRESDGASAR